MNILHVVPIYCSENQIKNFQSLGGGERYPFELAKFLAQNNLKDNVEIILFGKRNDTIFNEGVKINVIKGVRFKSSKNPNFSPVPFSWSFIKKIQWADVIHGYHIKSETTTILSIITKTMKKPLFLTDLGGGRKARVLGVFKTELLAKSVLCLSKFDSNFWKVKNKKIIYGGVDINKYKFKKEKQKYVLYIGRILPHKGVDTLIRALPDGEKLIVAGRSYDHKYLDYLRNISNNKQVKFIENPSDNEIINLYENASCFVLPSTHKDYLGYKHKKTELFGLVLIEAMACGTPVIASSAASLPELIRDGYNGYIFEDSNVNSLRKKMLTIINDPKLIQKMGLNGRKLVEDKFNWSVISKNVRSIYKGN
jgi:glycosyltransferase involved in cell wall biosynthesis